MKFKKTAPKTPGLYWAHYFKETPASATVVELTPRDDVYCIGSEMQSDPEEWMWGKCLRVLKEVR